MTNIAHESVLNQTKVSKMLTTLSHYSENDRSLSSLLSGAPPTESDFKTGDYHETSANYPIVKLHDLTKGSGDTVQYQIDYTTKNAPTMGNEDITGKAEKLRIVLPIDLRQIRFPFDSAGYRGRQRTELDTDALILHKLHQTFKRHEDQVMITHLAGARGFHQDDGWTIPLQSDPSFDEAIINPIRAPSYLRYFCSGGKKRPQDLTSTNWLTVADIRQMSGSIQAKGKGMRPIRFDDAQSMWDKPTYLMLVDSQTMKYLQSDPEWKRAVELMIQRKRRGIEHPFFDTDGDAYIDGIYVREFHADWTYPIIFPEGSDVPYDTGGADSLGNLSGLPKYIPDAGKAQVPISRSILMGAQALAYAIGRYPGGNEFKITKTLTNNGNQYELTGGRISGQKKLSFSAPDVGYIDMGCAVIDSYCPSIDSAEGRAILTQTT